MKRIPTRVITAVSIVIAAALFLCGWAYISNVRDSLWTLSVSSLKQITTQASHAFEVYLQKDLQNVHGMISVIEKAESGDHEYIEDSLKAYDDISDIYFYSVIDLEKGVIYSNQFNKFSETKLSDERVRFISGIGSGTVEEPYVSEVNGLNVLACHEMFTFKDGVKGVIRKASPVSKVVEDFAVTLYDGTGFSYIINSNGDILISSRERDGTPANRNLFDVMLQRSVQAPELQAVLDDVRSSMLQGGSGAFTIETEVGQSVCAYVPVGETNGWFYVTLVPGSVLLEQSNHILNITQLFIIITALILVVVFVVMLLVRKSNDVIRRFESEVHKRDQLFDILTNGTGDAFVMYNIKEKTVDYVSPNISYLMGIPAEKVKNDASVLLDPEDAGADFLEVIKELEIGGSVLLERKRINRRTKERQWFAITVYHAMIENEERAIVVFSDRTAEKKREQALEDATNIAESANRAKSAFLSNMSHDIRTPMNAIIGLCTLIERDAENPEQVRGHTKKMLSSSRHLLGLINDVLDMSKIEAGKTTLNISELNLAEIVDEIVTVMMPQAHAKGQTFKVTTEDVKSEHLLGDKLRINQILINIISNAVKYTPEGGNIELIIREMPKKVKDFAHLRFIVRDNGNGISTEYLGSIFNAFTRETNSGTNKIQGTGLGMAITKSLVDLMGGNISVESVPGEGSTFIVDLDLRLQDEEEVRKFWKTHNIKRILVVDDDEDDCAYVAASMERVEVTVEHAFSGFDAIAMVEKEHAAGTDYDLILMDLKMPEMDGVETTRRIRGKIGGKTPILAFTAYDWNFVEDKAREAGINGFMSKPFFITNLELCIEKYCSEMSPAVSETSDTLRGKHILAAEDNEMNSEILRELLDMWGATCDIEENGEKAVKRFIESSPDEYDFILMDIQMPVMNGYDAAKAIRACEHPRARTIPIFAMTADAFAEDVRRSIEAGMNAHIAKPIDMKVLDETVKETLAKMR